MKRTSLLWFLAILLILIYAGLSFFYKEPNKGIEEKSVDEVAVLTAFYNDFSANGTYDNLEDLVEKYGLYSDYRNNGIGIYTYKVACTEEEAKVISNADLKSEGNYVRIKFGFYRGVESIDFSANMLRRIRNDNSSERGNDTKRVADDRGSSTVVMGTTSFEETQDNGSSTEAHTPSKQIEMDSLQSLFVSLTNNTKRDEIDAYIVENGLMKYAFSHDSAYYIGYEYSAIRDRGRDRIGPAVDINFVTSGVTDKIGLVKSAEYTIHTGFDTHTGLVFKGGVFYCEGEACSSGEDAMQRFLANNPH